MKKILSIFMLLAVVLSLNVFVSTAVASAQGTTTHQVTFMLDENTEYKTVTVNHNAYLEMPETPSVDGKIFIEWLTAENDKFSFRTRITEDGLVLYANFENTEKYYTVSFILNGEAISIQQVKEGESAIEPKNLKVPEGKTFDRWSENFLAVQGDLEVNAVLLDVYYTVNVYAEDNLLDIIRVKHGEALDLSGIVAPEKANCEVDGNTPFVSEIDINSVKANGDVYVNYVPVTHSVTFYSEGTVFETLSARYGETAKMPTSIPEINLPEEEKEGYYFAGWALNSEDGELYDFNTLVEGDLELHAVFKTIEKPKYEVKFFDFNGNQYGGTQIVEEGNSAVAPGYPVREGYTFDGWNVDFSDVNSNLNIYPTYTLNSCTVTIKDYLGVVATEEVLYGQAVAIDESLIRTREGYQFVRFDRSLKNITADTVINAVYSIKTYDVRFYSSNLTSLGGLQKIKHGQNAIAPNVEKEGYTFLGWKNLNTNEIESTENITANCSFIATYSRNVYTVTFMEEDTVLHTTQIEYDRGFPSYNYEKEGYKFDGWYLDEELTTKYYASSIYQDTTLYAKWIQIVEEKTYFTVTYYVDDVVYYQQVVERGSSIVLLPAPSKEGFTFFKWHTDEWEYSENTQVPYNVNSDWNITPIFNVATFTVKFYFGSSSWVGHSVTVNYGEAVTFPDNISTSKEGYIFDGWDRDFSCVKSDLTVNAVYVPVKYTITFQDFNGQEMFTQTVNRDEYIQWVEDPVFEGYTFKYWINLDYTKKVTQDMTIKAYAERNSYKVYYYVDGTLWSNMTQTFYYGAYVSIKDSPSINTELKKFLGWSEAPEYMPAHDVEIYGTTYTYQFFNVYYLIDGEVWRTKNIREGKPIGTMTVYDVPNDAWEEAHENIVFKHWGEQPYYMPAEDVYVNAVIEKYEYYKVYFYIDGELYKIVTCMEGKAIPRPNSDEIQAMFPETKKFDGWGDLEWYMPSHDVEAHAEFIYKSYYNLNYYIEGKLFRSFTLLEGTVIDNTDYELTHADVPDDYLPENKEFRGWSTIPYSMPKEDVTINAYVHEFKYYKVTYRVDHQDVEVFEVLEGQPIPTISDPVSDGTRWFTGWTNSDRDIMPGYDVQRYAQWTYLNDIVTKTKSVVKDDCAMYEISLKVTGVVNFVAIKFKINLSVPAEVILDENYASYNAETGELLFVSGKVITEETTLITFSCGMSNPMMSFSFSGFEIYTIDEQGNIVSTVCYHNQNKQEPRVK